MDTVSQAKKIGYGQAFKAITVGLAVAYLLMTLMTSNPLWLLEFEYLPTIIFAVIVIYAAGFLFGQIAGTEIIIKQKAPLWIGVKHGFFIVWTSTFVASLVGFFKEGLADTSPISEPFKDYIYKPLLLVSLYGFIPIILVGLWFGHSINAKSRRESKSV